jgi:hypothetical protein
VSIKPHKLHKSHKRHLNNPDAPWNSPQGGGGGGFFPPQRHHGDPQNFPSLPPRAAVWFAQSTNTSAPPPPRPIPELLKEAATILWKGVPRFDNPCEKGGKFDPWTWEQAQWGDLKDPKAEKANVLVLLKGKLPSEAIEGMFKNPKQWSLDCACFVQAACLYTLLRRLGSGEFDKWVMEDSKRTKNNVIFGPHLSTGLRPKGGFRNFDIDGDRAEQTKRLAAAPLNSEVVFHNPEMVKIQSDSAWINENTIKLGNDQFIAYTGGGADYVVNRAAIEKILKDKAGNQWEKKHDFKDKLPTYLSNAKQIIYISGWVAYELL